MSFIENSNGLYWLRESLRHPRRALRITKKWISDRQRLPLSWRVWSDYLAIHHIMIEHFQRMPNLVSPSSYNDKLQWLKLLDRHQIQPLLVDKYSVRAWVSQKIGPEYLIPLRYAGDPTHQIPASALAVPYVIKSSHDSGSSVIVRAPSPEANSLAIQSVRESARHTFGVKSAEWAYRKARPRVLVEEIIGGESESLKDYKFHCSHGRVLWAQVIWDRDTLAKEAILTREGDPSSIRMGETMRPALLSEVPDSWTRMVQLAEVLSADFTYVRIDLYSVNGRIYFGEVTFWPQAGFYGGEGQKSLGDLLELPALPRPN